VIEAPLHRGTRPAHLAKPDLIKLAAQEEAKHALEPADATRGKPLFTSFACAGRHSLDGAKLVGPTLQKIATRANRKSLRQSILEPDAVIAQGFDRAMPSFAGVLSDQQLADLLAFLQTLQ